MYAMHASDQLTSTRFQIKVDNFKYDIREVADAEAAVAAVAGGVLTARTMVRAKLGGIAWIEWGDVRPNYLEKN